MKFDDLDTKMRVFETAADACVLPGVYMVARLDGRSFTRLTKEVCEFDVPFDERFRDMMVATTESLMTCGFQVIYGYTESDEISLLFAREENMFGRKLRKYNSTLAGEASARFSLLQASLDDIVAWAETQPWCQSMANCDQDAQWHSEGDVWTHTKMVCQQLTELQECPSLTDDERTVLIFTALLHDAAKPITSQTDAETSRITSPNHAVKGEHVARGILRDLGCDLATREQIARLVRYHGRPAFLLERSEPTYEVVRLSWLVNNRLLYLFALADTRGRDTDSMSRPEENLHYWKLLAEENACYDQPYPFASEHARFVFFRQREPNLYYVPHEDFACDVTVPQNVNHPRGPKGMDC